MKLKRSLFGDADAVGKLAWADEHFGPNALWGSIYKVEMLITKVVAGSPDETENARGSSTTCTIGCRQAQSTKANCP